MRSLGGRSMKVLAVVSILATVGLVWLGFALKGQSSQWLAVATSSPLSIRCLEVMAGGLVALAIMVGVLIRLRRTGDGAPRRIHSDQGGTAALEMVMLMPFALMIFLCIIQAALLFNANLVVHYAAFCGARMASVVVPLDMGEETARPPLVWPSPSDTDQGPSAKIEMIRKAAVLALIPISASIPPDPASTDTLGADVNTQTLGAFGKAGTTKPWWLNRIKSQYDYANAYTWVRLKCPDHWAKGNPDNSCPYASSRRTTWGDWGWNTVPYCAYYHRVPQNIWDFWYWEDLQVTVRFPFLLNVPFAGPIFSKFDGGAEASIPGRDGTSYTMTIPWTVKISNEGGPEIPPKDVGGSPAN
jgi:TadE-like protein